MLPTLDRDTRLCMSLSARPSNFGTRFHNALYRELGVNFVYKAFAITDIVGAIIGVRALNVRGCAISMPFKEAVIPLVDEMTPSAAAIASVNTIINDDGRLSAHNTDYIAVVKLLESHAVDQASRVVLRGSGGMAKAVAAALHDSGFRHGTIVARNEAAGRALAATYGFDWRNDAAGLPGDLLINVTPIGMEGGREVNDLAFSPEAVAAATHVFDVVALPPETPLIRLGRELGKDVITGAEVVALQAVEQFVLYTGKRPSDDQIARAAAFARG